MRQAGVAHVGGKRGWAEQRQRFGVRGVATDVTPGVFTEISG